VKQDVAITSPIFKRNMTYLVLEEGSNRQQIHIPECLEEVRRKFPKSAVNILLSSERSAMIKTCKISDGNNLCSLLSNTSLQNILRRT